MRRDDDLRTEAEAAGTSATIPPSPAGGTTWPWPFADVRSKLDRAVPSDWLGQATAAAIRVFGPRRRRWHLSDDRLHAEVRIASTSEVASLQSRLDELMRVQEIAAWGRVNGILGRAVFELGSGCGSRVDEVLALLQRAESECGFGDREFPDRLPEHPGDLEPLARLVVELSADLAGFWIAVLGQVASLPVSPFAVDVATLVSIFEGTPRLRELADRLLGRSASSLWLGVATAIGQGFVQSPLGPLVDVVHRSLQGAERLSRRSAWLKRESELCGKESVVAASVPDHTRPVEIPQGAIERYSDLALAGSVGAFGLGFTATGSIADSSPALLGGLPRPARLGREAFAALLTRTLSRRGLVTLDPGALRRLDLVDCVLISERLACDADAEQLQAAARTAGLAVRSPDDGATLQSAIRRLQGEGCVVLAVAGPDAEGLGAADVGVGLVRDGKVPWDSHVLAASSLSDVSVLLEACPAARDVAEQSVLLAEVGVGVGMLGSFGRRLEWATTSHIVTSLHVATLFAMANGARHLLGLALAPQRAVRDGTPWHALTATEALERLGSSVTGLTARDVAERGTESGGPPPSLTVRLLGAFTEELANPLTPVLAVGAGLSAAIGAVVDAGLVGAVMATDAAIGAVQRLRAQSSIDGLRAERPRTVRVIRAGREQVIEASSVVPGDIVRMHAGDFVPADCRILEAKDLEVDESSLTGESLPVAKSVAPTEAAEIADRSSILFEGTAVAAGEAIAVVFAVGARTEANAAATPSESPRTGVEARLDRLVQLATPLALGGGIATSLTGLLRGRPLPEVLSTAVSLAVAAVPEGLPMLATVAQVSAARRLSKRGVLVRNPRAIEALGRASVVCLDKTGTVTEGRIALKTIWDGAREEDVELLGAAARGVLRTALRASPAPVAGQRLPHGTDRALVDGARRAGVDTGAWSRRAELPFESERGFHAVLAVADDGLRLCVKGAPENVTPRCHRIGTAEENSALDGAVRTRIDEAARRMARRGLRVLAVAEALTDAKSALNDGDVQGLVFRGLLGLADPLRPTAAAAVSGLREAGVRLVMLTGDHPITAESIGAELGLLDGDVVTGSRIDDMDDEELAKHVAHAGVFARVAPRHKARLVRALQSAGLVVAMTGDGANDAPAIRLADVGIAIGSRCTTAARQAADVVVTDDRIETLVHAVLEGRALWTSVRDAVAVLVGGNLGELLFTVLADLASQRAPLTARQLLLLNLVTDTAPAIAIAMRPPPSVPPEQLLREGPDASLGSPLLRDVAWRALVTAGGASAAWLLAWPLPSRSTVALAALVGTQMGQTLVAGGDSPAVTIASAAALAATGAIVQTPGLSHFFGCRPLSPIGFGIAATVSAAATGASLLIPRLLPEIDEWLESLVQNASLTGADINKAHPGEHREIPPRGSTECGVYPSSFSNAPASRRS